MTLGKNYKLSLFLRKITIENYSDSSEVENIVWNKQIYNIPPPKKKKNILLKTL